MIDFALKIQSGIDYNKLSKKEKVLAETLISAGFLHKADILQLGSKFRVGRMCVTRRGRGFLEPLGQKYKNSQDLSVDAKDFRGAKDGDIVLGILSFSKAGRPSAKIVYIFSGATPYSVAYIERKNTTVQVINIKTGLSVNVNARQKALALLPKHTVLKINEKTGEISEVLGILEDPRVDEKISLALWDKHDEFDDVVIKEAESWGKNVDPSLFPSHKDLTALPFCTIDPPDAKDFDDAIYFDTTTDTLYVAIADVSSYVTPFSALDKEAIERGFSIYLPHRAIPMLPRNLSENICSLQPNKLRLAYVCEIKIDRENNKGGEHTFYPAIIQSRRRYTYDEIDFFLNGKWEGVPEADDAKIFAWLEPFIPIIFAVREKRLQSGLTFRSTEVRMTLNSELKMVESHIEAATDSHSLIEDCMLLANQAAAMYYDYGVFRVHPEPKLNKLKDVIDDLGSLGIFPKNSFKNIPALFKEISESLEGNPIAPYVDKLLIRTQEQARYEAVNKGHFGLGFRAYTHFTSPIRRYSDLTVHRLLKAIHAHDKKQLSFLQSDIEAMNEHLSESEREAARVEWDYKDRVFARWAFENVGKAFKGVVTDIKEGKETILTLEEGAIGARVFVDNSRLTLFDELMVTIIESNIATTRVRGLVKSR